MFTAQNFPGSSKNIEEQRFSSHRQGPFLFIDIFSSQMNKTAKLRMLMLLRYARVLAFR